MALKKLLWFSITFWEHENERMRAVTIASDLSTVGLYIVPATRFSMLSVNINIHIFSLTIHESHLNIKFPKQLQKASHNQYL